MKSSRRLAVWRAERDLTQGDVARAAGMSQTRYWQIEKGHGLEPNEDERKAVAAALGVKESDIAWPDVLKARAS